MKKGASLYLKGCLVMSAVLLISGMSFATSAECVRKCTVKPCRVACERHVNTIRHYGWSNCGMIFMSPQESFNAIVSWLIG